MLMVEFAGAAAILTLVMSIRRPNGQSNITSWRLLTGLGLGPLLPLVLRFYEFPAAVGAAPWPALRVAWVIGPLVLLGLLVLGWSMSSHARVVFALLAPGGGFLLLFVLRQIVLRSENESGASPDDALLWILCGGAAAVSTVGLWRRAIQSVAREVAA